MSNYINNIKEACSIKISFEGSIKVNYEGTHSTTREDKESQSQGRDTLDLSVDGKMSLEGSAEAIADGLKEIIYDNIVHHEEENKEA